MKHCTKMNGAKFNFTVREYFQKVTTLLSSAEISWPSWEKTVKLKLLWLSAMVISPAALMPTPMG